jgi:ElaB/YqjD/DUF883 family membrane-anchored ribosome-binding protein
MGQPWKNEELKEGGLVEKVKEKTQEVMAGAAELAGQAKDKAQALASSAAAKVKDAATSAAELGGQAKDKVQTWAATASENPTETFRDVTKEVTSLVRRYPIQSLLVGAAVGFLLARATTPRS